MWKDRRRESECNVTAVQPLRPVQHGPHANPLGGLLCADGMFSWRGTATSFTAVTCDNAVHLYEFDDSVHYIISYVESRF